MSKPRKHRPSPALVIACVALLISLGGTGYATVLQVPRNSVGTLQLQRNAVKAAKIAPNAVRAGHVLNGTLLVEDFKSGQIPQGPKGDKGDKGAKGDKGDPGATNVVARTTTGVTLPANSSTYRTTMCESGERAVGGSAGLDGTIVFPAPGQLNWPVEADGTPPEAGDTPVGWFATATNPTTAAHPASWYVICARP